MLLLIVVLSALVAIYYPVAVRILLYELYSTVLPVLECPVDLDVYLLHYGTVLPLAS